MRMVYRNTAILILQVEEEFHSTFYDVLKSFGEVKHSVQDTAQILNFCPKTLRKLVKEMGWDFMFPEGGDSVRAHASRKENTLNLNSLKALTKARAARFAKHAFFYQGIKNTRAGHARFYKITPKAVQYRMAHGIPLQYQSKSGTNWSSK